MRLPFYNKVEELAATAANMYRLGWHERNGGNISILLDSGETEGLDFVEAQRRFDTGFDASALAGRYLLVTGTGKYFKNLEKYPERDLGVIRISGDGAAAELVWGYTDGGRCTSELPSHLMGHISRLAADAENRVVMHSHPTNLIAMTCVHELDSREFTRTLWRMNNECIMVLPDGVNVLPWQLCGLGAPRRLRLRRESGRCLRPHRECGKGRGNLSQNRASADKGPHRRRAAQKAGRPPGPPGPPGLPGLKRVYDNMI